MKATVIAHPIQGLIKYHGLKDRKKRIPFHDSISVCMRALHTKTTVETVYDGTIRDMVMVNGRRVRGKDKQRIETVLNQLRRKASYEGHFKVASENSVVEGKGLGFSASGFAALGLAASEALGLDLDYVTLSETVRLGAGSATRSLAGGFAYWHADKNGHSYAEPLSYPADLDFAMVVVPVASQFQTDEAHAEVLSSPLFLARLKTVSRLARQMKTAVETGNVSMIGRLAEEDTLNLHAITMTGKSRLVLWEPQTVRVMREVMQLRSGGVEAYYSMDTGPSVFINTFKENVNAITDRLEHLRLPKIVVSGVGEKPRVVDKHLF